MKNKNLLILIILLMVIPAPLAIDEYVASLPGMVAHLQTTPMLLQLSVSLYMLAFAFSQIICGALSDAFGRRPIVIYATPIFLLGTLLCVFAPNVSVLLVGRVIQGIGIGACAMTCSTLIADTFTGKDVGKVTSYFSTVYAMVPIVAPVIGGYLQVWLGWRSNFAFLFFVVFAMYIFFAFKMPETHKPTKENKLQPKLLLKNYWHVLTHKKYMLTVCTMFLIWSSIIVFSILAPFILQEHFGYSPSDYGIFALFVGLGFMLGNMLNVRLLKYFSGKSLTKFGLSLSLCVTLFLFVLSAFGSINAIEMIALVTLFMLGNGISFPNQYGVAVSAIKELSGIANALIGSLLLIGTVIVTVIVGHFHNDSPVLLAVVYLLLSAVAAVVGL